MTLKHKKEKSKIISKAQKIPNTNNYSSHLINENKVVVQIPKEEVQEDLASVLTIATMFALHQIGIKDLDITIQEHKSDYQIIVEK